MPFNSVEFIFLFAQIALVIFFAASSRGADVRIFIIIVVSLIFYGMWRPPDLLILMISVMANFAIGVLLTKRRSPFLLTFGVVANLSALAVFKYSSFPRKRKSMHPQLNILR